MNNTISVALSTLSALVAAYFTYRAASLANDRSAEANRIAATKVDAEAYERAQQYYRDALDHAAREIASLRAELAVYKERLAALEKTDRYPRSEPH